MADALLPSQSHAVATLTQAEDQLDQIEAQVTNLHLVTLDFSAMTWDVATLNLSRLEETIKEVETLVEDARKAKVELQTIMGRANSSDAQIQAVRPRFAAADNKTRAIRVIKWNMQAKCIEAKSRIRTLEAAARTTAATAPATAHSQVKLPQLVLPKFAGDNTAYKRWRELFRASVEEIPGLNRKMKFAHLRTLLDGEPLRLVEEIPFDDDGYDLAIALLEKKYVLKDREPKEIVKSFQGLGQVDCFAKAKKFSIDVDVLCRKMTQLGKDIDNDFVLCNLEEKLDRYWKERVFALKDARPNNADGTRPDWNTTSFCTAFEKVLKSQEELGETDRDKKKGKETPTPQGQKPSKENQGRSKNPDSTPQSVMFPVTESSSKDSRKKQSKKAKAEKSRSNPNQQTMFFPQMAPTPQSHLSGQKQGFPSNPNQNPPKFPCFLCAQSHWSNDCPVYVSSYQRIARAKQLNLCLRCLRQAHPADQCRAKKPCHFCQGFHHQVLCPNRSQKQVSSAFVSQNSNSHDAPYDDLSSYQGMFAETSQKAPNRQVVPQKEGERLFPNFYDTTLKGSFKIDTIVTPSTLFGGDEILNQSQSAMASPGHQNLLMCSQARVQYGNRLPILAQVFLDSGSQRNLISTDFAARIGSQPVRYEEAIMAGFDAIPKPRRAPVHELILHGFYGKAFKLELFELERIVGGITFVSNPYHSAIYEKLLPAHMLSHCSPDVLIGVKDYLLLNPIPQEILPSGFTRIQSNLGDIIAGEGRTTSHRFGNINQVSSPLVTIAGIEDAIYPNWLTHQGLDSDFHLDQFVSSFLKAPQIGLETQEEDDEAVHKEFLKTITRQDNRYMVSLPWKQDEKPKLETNYGQAYGRFQTTIRKLRTRPELLEKYHQTKLDLLRSDIIEEVQNPFETPYVTHYLPHQAVLRDDKPDKLRIVYDGSARSKNGSLSLNECLHRGPVLLKSLAGILLRCRFAPYLVACDIEKAFLQILIKECDRDATRFLWTPNIADSAYDEKPRVFRFKRVAFGLICSPYLLAAVLNYHLDHPPLESLRILCESIKSNIYVDNILAPFHQYDDLGDIYLQIKSIFQCAQMNVREFVSNAHQGLSLLPNEDVLPLNKAKLLGLSWDVISDTIIIYLPTFKPNRILSKRTILSYVATPFDPLGLISPIVLPFRLYLKKIWEIKNEWDDEIPPALREEWFALASRWEQVTFSIPRYGGWKLGCELQIHTFADASGLGLGLAVYSRVTNPLDGDIQIQLLFSKSLVLPEKLSASIPRAELQSVYNAAKVVDFLKSEIQYPFSHKIWSDSTCVIDWLKGGKLIGRFEDNRLKQIASHPVSHVGTSENPADIASRGIDARDLRVNRLWWDGPSWLRKQENEWPPSKRVYLPNEEKEDDDSFSNDVLINPLSIPTPEIDFARFSKYSRIYRSMAYVIRAFIRLKKLKDANKFDELNNKVLTLEGFKQLVGRHEERPLRPRETVTAQYALFRIAQEEFTPSYDTSRDLRIFQDTHRLLRSQGRFENSDLQPGAIFPIYLPPKHRLTGLIITHVHLQLMHAGTLTVLAELRQSFWVPQGRRVVRRSIIENPTTRCTTCLKGTLKPYSAPLEPPLPLFRSKAVRVFQNSGIDYFGPVHVKNSVGEIIKIHVALFDCLVFRAVHLEIALDNSAEQCIHVLRRFFAKYGVPQNMISDNAPCFHASSKALPTMLSTAPKWSFVTELAPWRGGTHERLIALVKKCLRATVGRKILPLEVWRTMLPEAERVVNMRPITAIGDEEHLRPLRPIDFLVPGEGQAAFDLDPADLVDDPDFLLKETTSDVLRHKHFKNLNAFKKFQNMFREHYLISLRERHKVKSNRSPIEPTVDDVVIIREDTNPMQWRMGRVERLYKGADHQVRSALVKTDTGKLKRAVNQLYPFEFATKLENSFIPEISVPENPRPITLPEPMRLHNPTVSQDLLSNHNISQDNSQHISQDNLHDHLTVPNNIQPFDNVNQRPVRNRKRPAHFSDFIDTINLLSITSSSSPQVEQSSSSDEMFNTHPAPYRRAEGRGRLYESWAHRLQTRPNTGPFTIDAWAPSSFSSQGMSVRDWIPQLDLPPMVRDRVYRQLLPLKIHTFWQLYVLRRVLSLSATLPWEQAYMLLDFYHAGTQEEAMRRHKYKLIGQAPLKEKSRLFIRPVVLAWYNNIPNAKEGIIAPINKERTPVIGIQQIFLNFFDQDYLDWIRWTCFKASYELGKLHQEHFFAGAKFHNGINFLLTNVPDKARTLKHYKPLMLIEVNSSTELLNFFSKNYLLYSAEMVMIVIEPEVPGQEWLMEVAQEAIIDLFKDMRKRALSVVMFPSSNVAPQTEWTELMDTTVFELADRRCRFYESSDEASKYFILAHFGQERLTRRTAMNMWEDVLEYEDQKKGAIVAYQPQELDASQGEQRPRRQVHLERPDSDDEDEGPIIIPPGYERENLELFAQELDLEDEPTSSAAVVPLRPPRSATSSVRGESSSMPPTTTARLGPSPPKHRHDEEDLIDEELPFHLLPKKLRSEIVVPPATQRALDQRAAEVDQEQSRDPKPSLFVPPQGPLEAHVPSDVLLYRMSGLYAYREAAHAVKRDVTMALKDFFKVRFADRVLIQTGSSVHRMGLYFCDLDFVLTPNFLCVNNTVPSIDETREYNSWMRRQIRPLVEDLKENKLFVKTPQGRVAGELKSIEWQGGNPLFVWRLFYCNDPRVTEFMGPQTQVMDVDIAFGDASSFYLSILLKNYGLANPVLPYAVRTILLWARSRSLVGTNDCRMNSITLVCLVVHVALVKELIKEIPRSEVMRADQYSSVCREAAPLKEEDAVPIHSKLVRDFFRYLAKLDLNRVSLLLVPPYAVPREPKEKSFPRMSFIHPFSGKDICLAQKGHGTYNWIGHCLRESKARMNKQVCPKALFLTLNGEPSRTPPKKDFIDNYRVTPASSGPEQDPQIHMDGEPVFVGGRPLLVADVANE